VSGNTNNTGWEGGHDTGGGVREYRNYTGGGCVVGVVLHEEG